MTIEDKSPANVRLAPEADIAPGSAFADRRTRRPLIAKLHPLPWLFDDPAVPFGTKLLRRLVDLLPSSHDPAKRTMHRQSVPWRKLHSVIDGGRSRITPPVWGSTLIRAIGR